MAYDPVAQKKYRKKLRDQQRLQRERELERVPFHGSVQYRGLTVWPDTIDDLDRLVEHVARRESERREAAS